MISPSGSKALKEYWTIQHANHDRRLLTGTTGQNTWDNLRIASKIKVGTTVLEIGVGLGHSIREMISKGLNVSVVDIVPEAFECIKDLQIKTYLADQLDTLPEAYFDLAISHMVCCHQPDDILKEQIKYVINSLKPEGIFAILVAGLTGSPIPICYLTAKDLDLSKVGAKTRTSNEMIKLAEEVGGKVVYIDETLPQFSSWIYSYTIHITKKS